MEVILRLCVLVALVEELIAGGAETLPKLLRLLARHGADLLPLLLQGDQSLCGLLPLLAVLQGLGLLDQGELLLHILVHRVLELGVIFPLAGEELVAGGAEAVVDLLVLLSGGESDGPPLLLNILDLG